MTLFGIFATQIFQIFVIDITNKNVFIRPLRGRILVGVKNMKYFWFSVFIIVFIISCQEKSEVNDEDIYDYETASDEDSSDDCMANDFNWDYENEYSPYRLKQLDDGSFIFVGSWNEYQEEYYLNFSAVGIINKDYTLESINLFEQVGSGRDFTDVVIGPDDNIYTVGFNNSNASFLVWSFSNKNEKLWEKEWQYDGFYYIGDNNLYSVDLSSEGIVVAGFTAGWDEEGNATFPLLYLVKLNFNGEIIWEKVWDTGGTLANDVKVDADDDIYITGYVANSLDGLKNAGKEGDCGGGYQYGPEGHCPDAFLIKTDKDGDVLWQKQWGTGIQAMEYGIRIIIDKKEIYVLSNIEQDDIGNINLRKYNSSGAEIFSKNYIEKNRNYTEEGLEIYFDKNGNIIITGRSKEKDVIINGLILVVDKDDGSMIEKKIVAGSNDIILHSVFENEKGLGFFGTEIVGFYESTPGYIEPIFQYGVMETGYFYLDPKPDTTITKGDNFKRETLETGSEKDDEIVFSFKDSDGNLFVAGNTWGNIGNSKNKGEKDLFIAKYKADGAAEWTKMFGSSDWDSVSDGAVDSEGMILAGTTWGDFEGNERLGVDDVFIIKVDKAGKLLWAETAGSDNEEWLNGIWVDNGGNIIVTGGTYGSIDDNVFSKGFGCDIFVGKWDKDGNKIKINQWGQRIEGFGISGDNNGNIYVSGKVYWDYADQLVYDSGVPDSIIFKLDEDLNEMWARVWGSEAVDSATDIAIDSLGDIYVSGYTFGPMEGNLHLGENCPGGFCPDAYLTKFDSSGKRKWIRQFGTENGDRAYSVAINENDKIFVSGTAGKSRLCEIESDIFLIKSDTSGNLDEIKIWGTAGEEKVNSIDYSNGNLIISGFTTGGLDDNENQGGKDGFVTVVE